MCVLRTKSPQFYLLKNIYIYNGALRHNMDILGLRIRLARTMRRFVGLLGVLGWGLEGEWRVHERLMKDPSPPHGPDARLCSKLSGTTNHICPPFSFFFSSTIIDFGPFCNKEPLSHIHILFCHLSHLHFTLTCF